MSPAIRTTFEFEQVAVTIGSRTVDAYGEAVILGDRRTWWIDAISAEIDGLRCPGSSPAPRCSSVCASACTASAVSRSTPA